MFDRWRTPPWPTREYLVNHRYGILYCPIPKVACSSLKHWLRELEGVSVTAVRPDIHAALRARFSLGILSRRRANEILRSGYLKVAFVRHPCDRLASAFLNKFVPGKVPALRALVRRRQLAADRHGARRLAVAMYRVGGVLPPFGSLQREIDELTFRDFVTYVAADHASRLDKHWRPQHLFLGPWEFDFIGRFESLIADFAALCRRLGIEASLPHCNATTYAARPHAAECFADCRIADIRKLSALPTCRQLYTPDLTQTVATIYRQDMERFGYQLEPGVLRQADAA